MPSGYEPSEPFVAICFRGLLTTDCTDEQIKPEKLPHEAQEANKGMHCFKTGAVPRSWDSVSGPAYNLEPSEPFGVTYSNEDLAIGAQKAGTRGTETALLSGNAVSVTRGFVFEVRTRARRSVVEPVLDLECDYETISETRPRSIRRGYHCPFPFQCMAFQPSAGDYAHDVPF